MKIKSKLIEEIVQDQDDDADFEKGRREEHEDEGKCCECGSPDHTCQDCPISTGE